MPRKFFVAAGLAVVVLLAATAWLRWGDGLSTNNETQSSSEMFSAETLVGRAGADQSEDVPEGAATTMTLAGGDVSLSYPEGFGLAVTQEQLLISSYIPVCDPGFAYCIYLNSGEFDGTNFDGAGLRIVVRDDLDYEAACVLEQPTGYSGLQPVLSGGAGHATTVFGRVGEGAAGHYTNGALFRLYFADTCYEFETRVAQTQYANYEPGAVERFDDDDMKELLARFDSILASVSLPDGRDELWSRDHVPETLVPEELARVSEPTGGAEVTSPISLRGEARGTWFFEGSFPYRLQTDAGDVLASGVVEADGDWTTTDFVPFSQDIEFDVDAPTSGVLVLMNDNPSGLRENDESLLVPLNLGP